jgi:putative membrane protein
MQTKKLLVFVSFSFLSLCASAAPVEQKNTSTAVVSQTEAQKNDGKIIKILIKINKGEIAAAHEALKRSTNPEVKNFAQQMITDHGKNLAETKALAQKYNIVPMASEKSDMIQKQNEELLKKLASVPQNEFNKTYIQAMVQGHEEALNAIETKLLPQASNAALKEHLKATRVAVIHHLKMAKETQSTLAKK